MRTASGLALAATLSLAAMPAHAEAPRLVAGSSPVGRDYVRLVGPKALAPTTGLVGALVAVPPSARAEDLGLEPVAPGIGRLRGSAAKVEAWSAAHPELRLEAAMPVHTLLDRAGEWVATGTARRVRGVSGKGVLVGVADTGLDVTHAEFRQADGKTRVKWIFDLSLPPSGKYPELEDRFGVKNDAGTVVYGRVFAREDIDAYLEQVKAGTCDPDTLVNCSGPSDEAGHGTHVTGLAAAGGLGSTYPGAAPEADIVFVRVTRGDRAGIENDDLLRAVQFMFDRADAEKQPMVVNLSLGADFGPHDGTTLWERAIAAQVGPEHPGHIVLAASGNSGSIVETPIHQSVRVTKGNVMRVPVRTRGAESGSVQVWVTLRNRADLKVGLDGPDGEWIPPVEMGKQAGKNEAGYNAGVIYGNAVSNEIPSDSRSAVVVWQGKWPTGTYSITLEGEGVADLYLEGFGDADIGGDRPAIFASAVREGTVNIPATHPSIIGVGCTVNRTRWTSIGGVEMVTRISVLDREGGLALTRAITPQAAGATTRELQEGEVCWFSSAGPTAAGVPKPEIAAPGAILVSAMSRNAAPGSPGSVFTTSACPLRDGKPDRRCLQIDDTHAVASGTSMSTPIVAGVVALLLEADPTLTQDKVLALLQAGAHRYRTSTPFDDQAGPGEVDAMGSLDALDQSRNPTFWMPSAEKSWIALSSDYVAADGSTPLTAIVELRTADGLHRGDMFDAARLQPLLLVDGNAVTAPPRLVRRGPGVWFFVWNPPPGLGGARATFGATFDGQPIVSPKTIPIGPDRWTALYPNSAHGSGCATSSPAFGAEGLALLALLVRRRRRHSSARVTSQPCGSHTSSSGSNA